MDDESGFGGMRNRVGKVDEALYTNDSRTVERTYKFSTGLDLTFPFEISLNPISFGFSKRYVVKPDPSQLDTTITYPEFSVDARTPALMKVGVVANLFKDLSRSSNFRYKKSTRRLMLAGDTTVRFDLSPLISVTGNVKKWPINFNYSHRYSNEANTTALTENGKITNGDELTYL
jgi:hypothetical protein